MKIPMLPAERTRRATARQARLRAEKKAARELEAQLGLPPMSTDRPVGAPPETRAGKRDAAEIIKNRVLDALANISESEGEWIDGADGERHFIRGSSILSKDLQPALGTALKAQALEDKREATKKGSVTFVLQLAAAMGERMALLTGGEVIEGEATEIV